MKTSELCIRINKDNKNMNEKTRNSRLYLLLVVGAVSAFGPFVTDFYLPALPSLNEYFHTTASLVQLSLTFSMIGLAVGQLVIGPLSDKYGRKAPLQLSLVAFSISTLGCIYALDIYWFVFFRLIQGLAGAGGLVISKSIAVDLYEGKELPRFFSMLSSVMGLAPICAPVLGGFLLEVTSWKGIFWILFAIGLLLLAALSFFKESLPHASRRKGSVWGAFRRYAPVLSHGRFMCYVMVQAFAMGVMFTYIAASPFIFQNYYGLSPVLYSLCFGANAVAIMLGSLTVSLFRSATQAMRVGVICFGLVSLLVAAVLVSGASVLVVEACLFLFMLFLGMILPSSTMLALDLERENSGNASAVHGFLMFLFGGIFSPLTGMGDMLQTTSLIMVLCCAAALVCTLLTTARFSRYILKGSEVKA